MIDNLLEEYEDLIRETVILLSDVEEFVDNERLRAK
jgi:hypothetical protein